MAKYVFETVHRTGDSSFLAPDTQHSQALMHFLQVCQPNASRFPLAAIILPSLPCFAQPSVSIDAVGQVLLNKLLFKDIAVELIDGE